MYALLVIMLPLVAMDNNQEKPIQKTEPGVYFDVKTTPKAERPEIVLDQVIMEGSLQDFQSQAQLDQLSYEQLAHLKSTLHMRTKALEMVSASVGAIGDHIEQIKAAIKKMPKEETSPELNTNYIHKAAISNRSRYIQAEKTKLAAIEKLVEAEFNQYQQHWFTHGERIGYTVAKNETKS